MFGCLNKRFRLSSKLVFFSLPNQTEKDIYAIFRAINSLFFKITFSFLLVCASRKFCRFLLLNCVEYEKVNIKWNENRVACVSGNRIVACKIYCGKANMQPDKETVVKTLRSLLNTSKNGLLGSKSNWDAIFGNGKKGFVFLSLWNIIIIYDFIVHWKNSEMEGIEIPYKAFGYQTLLDFLRDSKQFDFSSTNDGMHIRARLSQDSQHIVALVGSQNRDRRKKSTKSMPFYPQRFSSNGNRNFVKVKFKISAIAHFIKNAMLTAQAILFFSFIYRDQFDWLITFWGYIFGIDNGSFFFFFA